MKTKEIKFRQNALGDLVGHQSGMRFFIGTEPGTPACAPAHWVAVDPGRFSTLGHQYFHLDEAREFCQRIAAGEIDIADLRAQYDAEDKAKILDDCQDRVTRIVLFLARQLHARLKAKGLTCSELLELGGMLDALGERGRDILLDLEREEKSNSGVESPLLDGVANKEVYHENIDIIPQNGTVRKG